MTTDKTYWKALEERYFEGLTTKEEERLLRQFLTTEMAQTEDFEELRAVMGFLAMGKVEHKKKVIPLWRRPAVVKWSAAACVLILGGIGIVHLTSRTNSLSETTPYVAEVPVPQAPTTTYVAYIDGSQTTDKAEVIAQMHGIMADINAETATDVMEASMSDLLNTLNFEE